MITNIKEITIKEIFDIQDKAYKLLVWLNEAIGKEIISVSKARNFISDFYVAKDWLVEHYKNIPENARPKSLKAKDLNPLLNIFSSYAYTSFQINTESRVLYVPYHIRHRHDEQRIVESHIVPLKLERKDKLSTLKYKLDTLEDIALVEDILIEEDLSMLLKNNQKLNEAVAVITYYNLLLERMNGKHYGKTHLALWREFAWTKAGSPKQNFKFTETLYQEHREKVLTTLQDLETKELLNTEEK